MRFHYVIHLPSYHDLKTIGYVLFLLTQFLLTRVFPIPKNHFNGRLHVYLPTLEIQNMFIRNTECDVILCSDNTKLLISKKSKHHPKKPYLKSKVVYFYIQYN